MFVEQTNTKTTKLPLGVLDNRVIHYVSSNTKKKKKTVKQTNKHQNRTKKHHKQLMHLGDLKTVMT